MYKNDDFFGHGSGWIPLFITSILILYHKILTLSSFLAKKILGRVISSPSFKHTLPSVFL